MSLTGFTWIFAAALATIFSNLMLRMGVLRAGGFGVSGKGLTSDLMAMMSQPLFLIGLILYCVAALIWFYIVSTQQLATAYVILVALAFIGVTVASHFAFGETMTITKIAGFAIVLVGIAVVSRG